MRYFYDTEFIEDGQIIDLVSIGVVAEDGREFYAVSTEFDERRANPWVRANVLDQLPNPQSKLWMSRATLREQLLEFLTAQGRCELWAWSGCYDHVVLAQLWGDMAKMPKQLPRFTHELRQYWEMAGRPPLPPLPEGQHDALVDARHNLAKYNKCKAVLPLNARGEVTACYN